MDLVELERFPSDHEAQLFAMALRGHGVHATVVNDGLASIMGAGYNAIPARVLVPENERADAQVLMVAIRAEMDEPPVDEPSTCQHCGEDWEPGFTECWSCSKPR